MSLIGSSAALLLLLMLNHVARAEQTPATQAIEVPQRVFCAGHSFHVPMAVVLEEIYRVEPAHRGSGIAGALFRGGSEVQQVWEIADKANTAKKALREGKVDVLTVSPVVRLPDPGIDRFADLAVQHNPDVRVLVQLSWPAFDSIDGRFRLPRRDETDLAALHRAGEGYRKAFAEQIAGINKRLGKPVVFSVPTGLAVFDLREKIRAKQVPGIATQAELFSDALGHPREVITVLNAYCHYAVIHRKSPQGLAMPTLLKRLRLGESDREALNAMLQEIAWSAARRDGNSGVK